MLKERLVVSENAHMEMVVWRQPSSGTVSQHGFKYRLVFVVNGRGALHYDNERGKGDH